MKLFFYIIKNNKSPIKKILLKTKLILAVAVFTSLASFSQKKWTLKECVDQALERNISVQQSKLNLKLAEKDVAIANGNFLPNLNGGSSGNFNSGLSPDRNGVLTIQITLMVLLV